MILRNLFPSPVAVGDIPDFPEVLKEIKDSSNKIQKFLRGDTWNDNVYSTNKDIFCILTELNLTTTKKVIQGLFEE